MPNPDPAIANAAYMELRDCVTWLFADDSDDTLARRRHALGKIDSLRPATPMEASLAAQLVALDLHGKDSLRLAAEHRDEVATALKCRNNANAMVRQMLRTQAKLEAMQQARRLGSVTWNPATTRFEAPDQPALIPEQSEQHPPPITPPTAAAPAAPAPATLAPAAPRPAETDPNPPLEARVAPDALAKAEQYAATNRVLATRIRRAGGLTRAAVAGFRPSAYPQDGAVLRALVSGDTPILAALDGPQRQAA